MSGKSCLDQLEPGQKGRISSIEAKGDIRRRLQDLGAVAGTEVTCVGADSSGDTGIYRIRNAMMVIRREEAGKILLQEEEHNRRKVIVLTGNPNVGKSTLFNSLTGAWQHTGNWAGKTTRIAEGKCSYGGQSYTLVDIPGCYSLMAGSAAEAEARDFLCFREPDAAVVVCEAACLERSMALVLQIMEAVPRTVVCVNMMDEAAKKGIRIDIPKLEQLLGVPVTETTATKKIGLHTLMKRIEESLGDSDAAPYRIRYPGYVEEAVSELEGELRKVTKQQGNLRWCCCRLLDGDEEFCRALLHYLAIPYDKVLAFFRKIITVRSTLKRVAEQQQRNWRDDMTAAFISRGEQICAEVCEQNPGISQRRSHWLERLTSGKYTALPLMLLLLAGILWLTVTGAGISSPWLSSGLLSLEEMLAAVLLDIGMPAAAVHFLIGGVYRTVAWMVVVMLPPMLIFLPLFTLLEDIGYLPRIALNVDRCFSRCHGCGKQALTMCMEIIFL